MHDPVYPPLQVMKELKQLLSNIILFHSTDNAPFNNAPTNNISTGSSGSDGQEDGDNFSRDRAQLVLARNRPGEMAESDDEVLHISNAPLFIAAPDKRAVNR